MSFVEVASAVGGVIGWTLVHSLWQVTAAYLIFSVLHRRARTPQARYAFGIGTLGAIVVTMLTTAWLSTSRQSLEALGDAGRPQSASSAAASPSGPTIVDPLGRVRDEPLAPPSSLQVAVAWADEWLPYAVLAWAGGGIVLTCGHIASLWQVTRLVRRCGPVADEDKRRWARAAARLGLGRPVRFLCSDRVLVPMAVGWIKPCVLTPVHLLTHYSVDEIDAVILHELAHVRRLDYFVNQLQAVLESVLYFHPCLWLLSARVRNDRELCCDAVAAGALGRAKPLATALVRMADQQAVRNWRLAMSAAGGSVLERVTWMASGHRGPAVPFGTRMLTLLCAGVCVFTLGAGFRQQAQADREFRAMLRLPECVALADVMGEAMQNADFEGAFVDALVASQSNIKADDVRYARLVEASRVGVPAQMVWRAWSAAVPPGCYPTVPSEYPVGWKYAGPGEQRRLARRLWSIAKQLPDEDAARAYGLTALRVAAMRRETCQVAALATIAFDGDFARLTGLNTATGRRIRRYVSVASDRYGDAALALRRLESAAAEGRPLIELRQHLADSLDVAQLAPETGFVAACVLGAAESTAADTRRQLLTDGAAQSQAFASAAQADPSVVDPPGGWAVVNSLLAAERVRTWY